MVVTVDFEMAMTSGPILAQNPCRVRSEYPCCSAVETTLHRSSATSDKTGENSPEAVHHAF
jgi:hypothetical protein